METVLCFFGGFLFFGWDVLGFFVVVVFFLPYGIIEDALLFCFTILNCVDFIT